MVGRGWTGQHDTQLITVVDTGYLPLHTDRGKAWRYSAKTPPVLQQAEVFDISSHSEVIPYQSGMEKVSGSPNKIADCFAFWQFEASS